MNNHLIKFRVWDKKNNYFLDTKEVDLTGNQRSGEVGELLLDFTGKLRLALYPCGNGDNSADSVFNEFKDDRFIISCFIGIQDKNGIDLFEGDKINFEIPGISHGPEREYIKNALVWYNENDTMYCFGKYKMNDGQDYWYSFADNIDRKTIEIVGNIYGM